ncbi:MAG: MFS transporter [Alphaproteobacteria bacterium]|nr:MFS transporter [Alphaproteobacteria bacterium]
MTPPSSNGDDPRNKSWRSLWLSSGALSLALLGDALIYIVLPVNAHLFGVSLAWVGVLLAANRIVRTFSYGMIAVLGERIGMRNLCILASITAVISTAMYGLFQGWAPLLAGRILWGLSYGAMLLVALGYAASDRARTGTRVGVSRAIEQIGPLFALTAGAWLAGILGPRDVFYYLALVSCAAALFAYLLPRRIAQPPASAASRPRALPKPERLDILIFWMGFGVDGVFTMTVTIMLAEHVALELAMLAGGSIFAGRRVIEMFAAPLSGLIADRLGVHKPLIAASLLLSIGLACVGVGWLYAGATAIVVARGALGTLIPAAVALFAPGGVLPPLARNQTWRDIGAALGPLTTGFLLASTSPETLHIFIAAAFLASLLWLLASPAWRASRTPRAAERSPQ